MSLPSAPPPTSRSEWLGARAALAGRRSGRFAIGAVATFVGVLIILFFVPKREGASRATAAPVTRDDTTLMRSRADSAHRAAARADSQYATAVLAPSRSSGQPQELTAVQRFKRDSLQYLASELDTLAARAAAAPTPDSYRALAAAMALHGDSRTSRLADSLNALEKRAAESPDPQIAASASAVGTAIRDVATRRRASLARATATIDSVTRGRSVFVDTVAPRALRDSARAAARRMDSTLDAARGRRAAAERAVAGATDRATRRAAPVAMLFAAMVIAVIGGFSFNLSAEIRKPTLATPREAERVANAPILAVAHDSDRVPRIGGIDPFRMLYLGLTATGTRTRTVMVSGDDRGVAATVAGRLALAAAADARATLIVDADAEGSGVAAYYGERPEPGFSDALAGVRLWREVTRPIGASDGLSIDVMPGGAIRSQEPDRATKDSARDEFARFRADYDFAVIVAPSHASLLLVCSLVEGPAAVLCAETDRTRLDRLAGAVKELRDAGAVLHGLTIWDAELPELPPRSELMTKTMAARVPRPIPEGQ